MKPPPPPWPAGKCYDNYHNLVETGCFDVPVNTDAVVSYYPSLYGFVLSAAQKGHPDYSTPYWSVAPPLTNAGQFVVPLKQGCQFVLTLDARQTQVFESPASQYSTNVGVSASISACTSSVSGVTSHHLQQLP